MPAWSGSFVISTCVHHHAMPAEWPTYTARLQTQRNDDTLELTDWESYQISSVCARDDGGWVLKKKKLKSKIFLLNTAKGDGG